MTAAIKNVTVFGATGAVGRHVLDWLQKFSFNTTAVIRASSSSPKFAPAIKRVTIADDFPVSELKSILQGQDAVIVALTATTPTDLSNRIVDAAAEVGVKHFIPAEYSVTPKGLEYLGYRSMKTDVTDNLKAKEGSGMSWTAIETGPFLDYGISNGWLGFDLAKQEARIFDDGNVVWSATNNSQVAEAAVRAVLHADRVKNQHIYVSSVETSQNEILRALESETGSQWKVTDVTNEEEAERAKALLQKGELLPGIKIQLLNITFTEKFDSNFAKAGLLDNDKIGLEQDNVHATVKRVLQEHASALR